MPNDTTATLPLDEIQFIEDHRPALDAGDYTLTLEHDFKTGVTGTSKANITKRFSVRGPRYSLLPELIHTRFPPPGSRGHDWHVFPHIVLERSTLPWERTALKGGGSTGDPPWLALLLFTQDEAKGIKKRTASLSTIRNILPKETGENEDDKIAIIDVKRSVLDPLLPKGPRNFALRAHARLVQPAGTGPSVERAVVMCNRLPKPGQRSEVHLVSLEGRYTPDCAFVFESGGDDALVPLVTLASWSFFCLDDK